MYIVHGEGKDIHVQVVKTLRSLNLHCPQGSYILDILNCANHINFGHLGFRGLGFRAYKQDVLHMYLRIRRREVLNILRVKKTQRGGM